jgi:hypothetical protein
MSQSPEFGRHQRPAEIVAAAGEWLAGQVGEGARYIRSRRAVEQKIEGRVYGIGLQTSTWSRAGQGTWVTPRIWVTDARVADWQKEHDVRGLYSRGGYIFTTLIINLGFRGTVELFGPQRSTAPDTAMSLGEFWTTLEGQILPTLRLFRGEPADAVERLPERWLVFPEPLFWWAAAYGDSASARAFLARYFKSRPSAVERFEAGRRAAAAGEPAPEAVTGTLDFAWSAVSTGVLSADEAT